MPLALWLSHRHSDPGSALHPTRLSLLGRFTTTPTGRAIRAFPRILCPRIFEYSYLWRLRVPRRGHKCTCLAVELQHLRAGRGEATNLVLDAPGSITFWFAPDWSSTNACRGSGPGEWAQVDGRGRMDNEFVLWVLGFVR